MSKFLFTYVSCLEGIVEGGKPKGGSLVQTLVWMRALYEMGHEIYLAKYENEHREIRREFAWVKTIEIYDKHKFRKRMVWITYRFPKYFAVLRKNKFDYVYHSIPSWKIFVLGFFCRYLGAKQIVRIANDKNVEKTLSNDLNFFEWKVQILGIKYSDLVVAQNRFQFDIIKEKIRAKNVTKISNPIILDNEFLKQKKHYRGYIAWIANFRHQKNLALLLDVALKLPEETFKVAGQPLFPMDKETQESLEGLKRLQNVEFMGVISRQDILNFLDHAKFLLSTSRYEGFSNTFLESMMTGTPILTSDKVDPDSIISSFNLGIVYSNAGDLVSRIQELNVEEYLLMSQNCTTYLSSFHDHLALGNQLLSSIPK